MIGCPWGDYYYCNYTCISSWFWNLPCKLWIVDFAHNLHNSFSYESTLTRGLAPCHLLQDKVHWYNIINQNNKGFDTTMLYII
jgi:hypothetical protein